MAMFFVKQNQNKISKQTINSYTGASLMYIHTYDY